jgi:hypothetical protein
VQSTTTADSSRGSDHSTQGVLLRAGELGTMEATGLAPVGCQNQGTIGISHQSDPIPGGQRSGDQKRGDVKELLEAVDLVHPGALQKGRDHHLRCCRRRGVGPVTAHPPNIMSQVGR